MNSVDFGTNNYVTDGRKAFTKMQIKWQKQQREKQLMILSAHEGKCNGYKCYFLHITEKSKVIKSFAFMTYF